MGRKEVVLRTTWVVLLVSLDFARTSINSWTSGTHIVSTTASCSCSDGPAISHPTACDDSLLSTSSCLVADAGEGRDMIEQVRLFSR